MKLEEFLNGKNVETYFDEKLKECKDYDELPRELKNCSCCTRHKKDFPILGQKNIFKKYNCNKNQTEVNCKCPCRHMARHICREWDLIHEVEEIETEDSDEDSSEDSSGSLKDFIVPDEGYTKKERKKMDQILKQLRR